VTTEQRPVLGLIGAIGAGKTTAAAAFAARGGFAIDCDHLGHVALAQPEVLAKLTKRWGTGILHADGTPNRRAIGAIVFADAAERTFLESVVFPAIGELARAEMAKATGNPRVRFIVLDAAVLLEAGWGDFCDRIAYVDAPRDVRLSRVKARSGWTEAELERREGAQWPAERRMMRADAVIANDGSVEQLQSNVDRLLTEWGWIEEKDGNDD
jgi:dephospho-CoA kinase